MVAVPAPVPSEARFESLTRALMHVAWITDADGHFTAPQPTWSAYTGQPWEEHQGLGWHKAVHPDDLQTLWRCWLAARADRALFIADGRMWHAPSGGWRFFEVRAVPNTDADGVIREWIGTCIDVHDRRSAEHAMRVADRRKDEFMAVLAHELRNPLAPIRNSLEILQRTSDPKLAQRSRDIAQRQVQHMVRLVDDLLDVSRISRGKIVLQSRRVRAAEVLDAALETSRPLIEQRRHQLVAAPVDGSVELECDPTRVAQILTNLLNNAANYTPEGGRIEVGATGEGETVRFLVRDSGVGLTAEQLRQVFELFVQVNRDATGGGLGIGLSLAARLAELHGGRIEAGSEGLGLGATFVLVLPRLPADG